MFPSSGAPLEDAYLLSAPPARPQLLILKMLKKAVPADDNDEVEEEERRGQLSLSQPAVWFLPPALTLLHASLFVISLRESGLRWSLNISVYTLKISI